MTVVYPNELYHHGIKGQRWGIRRFQNPDGTLTPLGKKRYGSVENLQAGRTKKQAEKFEADKKAAIASGKASEVKKFSSQLSQEELDEAMKRIKTTQALDDLKTQDLRRGKEKLEALIAIGGQVKQAAQVVTDNYNTFAKLYNAWNKDGKKLPIAGESPNYDSLLKKLSYEKAEADWKREQEYIKAHGKSREEEAADLKREQDKTRWGWDVADQMAKETSRTRYYSILNEMGKQYPNLSEKEQRDLLFRIINAEKGKKQ